MKEINDALQRLEILEDLNNKLQTTNDFNPASEILRPKDIQMLLGGVARSYVDNLAKNDPHFPKKITITSRLTGYRKKSFYEWLEKKEKGLI